MGQGPERIEAAREARRPKILSLSLSIYLHISTDLAPGHWCPHSPPWGDHCLGSVCELFRGSRKDPRAMVGEWSWRLAGSSHDSGAQRGEKETLPGLTNMQSVHAGACSVRVSLFFTMSALDIDLWDFCSALVILGGRWAHFGAPGAHLDDARSEHSEF